MWKCLIFAVVLSCLVPCKGASTNKKPFTLESGTTQLKDISRIGAKGKEDKDSAGTVAQLKDFAFGLSESLQSIQKLYRSGDTEAAAAKLKSSVGNINTLIETSKETKQIAGLDGFHETFDAISSEISGVEDIPNTLLGDFIQPILFDGLVEFSSNLADSFENIDQSTLTGQTQSQRSTEHVTRSQASDDGNNGHTFLNQQTTFNHHFPNLMTGFSLPKVSDFCPTHDHEIVMAKHQIRQDALGDDVCEPACNLHDWRCNCRKLFGCVRDITPYGMQIVFSGGYIDTTPGSSTLGEFKLDGRNMNLYDMEHNVRQKLNNVQALVEDSPSRYNRNYCETVLEQFHSACDTSESSCSHANQQSFQATADQVCKGVNTTTKLKFEAIGDEFDGFIDTAGQTTCALSYDTCEEFIRQFDRLYDGRDVASYPEPNPMIKAGVGRGGKASKAPRLFLDDVQFPIGYIFPQNDVTGVIDRSFGSSFYGQSQETLHDKVFSLVNPTTGRALTLPPNPEFQPNNFRLHLSEVIMRYTNNDANKIIGTLAECQKQCTTFENRQTRARCRFILYYSTRQTCFLQEGYVSRGSDRCFSSTLDDDRCGLVNVYERTTAARYTATHLIQQEYEPSNIDQQFKLNEDDQLESVRHPGNYITEMLPDVGPHGCRGAIGLGLKHIPRGGAEAAMHRVGNYQEWRSHPHGLVNRRYDQKCQYGDTTFTSIEDNSFENITYFEHISFSFVDPSNGQALTVGNDNETCAEESSRRDNALCRTRMHMEQFNETEPNQKFQISRCANSDQECTAHSSPNTGYSHDDIFVIRSVLISNYEVIFHNCQEPRLDNGYESDQTLWKIGSAGSLESVGCPDHDLFDVSSWRVMTNDVVLLEVGQHDHSTQMWSPVFAAPGYELALMSGFHSDRDADSCLTSSHDRSLAKSAMRSCDESMSFLIGSQASVGRLKAIADLITSDSSRMPGYCCMDVATNSAFFGYTYDPRKYSTVGTTTVPMRCEHHGPWHLGISAEACENAGGDWFRTSCLTLKETIDRRPSRFDLDTPFYGSCQDAMGRLETAYVSAATHHELFPFASTNAGCLQFCQSLPKYPSQTGMMYIQGTDEITVEDRCTCIYPDGEVPSMEVLPSYATPSPPVFTLVDSMGMALGLRPNIDCNSEDASSVETQVSDPTAPRQQFQLTHHGQVVSVQCPEMVLAGVLVETDDSCSERVRLQMSHPTSPVTPLQQWTFNTVTGSITNKRCTGLAISSKKEQGVILHSIYFTVLFFRTDLVIGVVEGDCTLIESQVESIGSPNQQFLYIEEDKTIASLMCPNKIIGVQNCAAAATTGLRLSEQLDSLQHKWTFDTEENRIRSDYCEDMFITIGGASEGGARTTMLPLNHNKGADLSIQEEMSLGSTLSVASPAENAPPVKPEYANETITHSTYTPAENLARETEWENRVLPTSGSPITLSGLNTGSYQSCEKKYRSFSHLVGPYSIVSPATDKAITSRNGELCHQGMGLLARPDNPNWGSQKFYLGYHGSIFSRKCPGLVLSVDQNDTTSIILEIFQLDTPRLKWNFTSGTIENAANQGMVVGSFESAMILRNITTTPSIKQSWNRINTRLMNLNDPRSSSWSQEWTALFITPVSGNGTSFSTLQEITVAGGNTICYSSNTAFSASFDEFARPLTINDASDEEQCRSTREALGFDKDHPFDTEIREKFHAHMCDPFFTGIDHTTDLSTMTAPPQFEMVEHTSVEYEAAEYNGVNPPATIDYVVFDEGGSDDHVIILDILPDDPVPCKPDGSCPEPTHKSHLANHQIAWLDAGHTEKAAELLNSFLTGKAEALCDVIPAYVCGALCAINPPRIACKVISVIAKGLANAVLLVASLTYQVLDTTYTLATMHDDEAYYGYHYSQATYHNTIKYNQFTAPALQQIKTNMKAQHEAMANTLQKRHREIADHLGNAVADAQNTLGSAIVGAQNQLDEDLVTTQNALGSSIVDAQNTIGNQVVDTQNYITLQHNRLSEWLYGSLCFLFARDGITCELFVGPLEEDQSSIPVEFHWPEGHLTMIERLEQVQRSLSSSASDGDNYGSVNKGLGVPSLSKVTPEANKLEVIKSLVDAINLKVHTLVDDVVATGDIVESKLGAHSEEIHKVESAFGSKLDAHSVEMQEKVNTLVGKGETLGAQSAEMQTKVNVMQATVYTIQEEVKDIKDMIFSILQLNKERMHFAKE